MKKIVLLICICFSLFIFVGCSSQNINNETKQVEQVTKELRETRLKVDEALKKYNQTLDQKYLDEANSYSQELGRLKEKAEKIISENE